MNLKMIKNRIRKINEEDLQIIPKGKLRGIRYL